MNKDLLRKKMLKKRHAIPDSEVLQKSNLIMNQLQRLDDFAKADTILFYFSKGHEVQTGSIIQRYVKQKTVYLPVLVSETVFEVGLVTDIDLLKANRYGILEPQAIDLATPLSIDLILVPGVAFDLKGGRLGMGKGYYDRFLSRQKKAKKIALAFDEQVLDEIPKGPYDEDVDIVLTETRLVDCKGNKVTFY